MHEWGLVKNIIDAVAENLPKEKKFVVGCVEFINLAVGPHSGVGTDCLKSGFDILKENTCCSNALINIEFLKPKIECLDCKITYEKEFLDYCPTCENKNLKIKGGMEFFVKSFSLYSSEPA